jgi:phenylpyruvate tautomerase PptA (4-oxalocrotonate tautomerase family)
MPIYEVYHRTPLSDGQKTQIADAITARHSERFTTPRLFVNVIFTDSSKRQVYINAKPVCFYWNIQCLILNVNIMTALRQYNRRQCSCGQAVSR